MEDDLDDLFGDGTPLQITAPLTPALISHLNECSTTGCCQQVAWSKSGIIASLTADKQGVLLQHLACDPQSGQWRLSKQYPVDDVAAVHGNVELVHLAWDNYTNFLAICDVQGRISVYLLPNINLAINRLMAWRRCVLDPKDDLSIVVGLAWLPPERVQSLFARSAVRKEGRFSYVIKQQAIPGPKAPPQKPALIVVTRSGRVKFLSTDKERWIESRIELEASGKPNGVLTHAALCLDPMNGSDSMLLTTHSSLGELRLYRLKIDVNASALTAQRLTILRSLSTNAHVEYDQTDPSSKQGPLIHLEFIPASGDLKSPTLPKILTVFTCISHDYQGSDTFETCVRSWEITPDATNLHTALKQLAPKKSVQNATDLGNSLRFVKSTEFSIAKAPLVLQHLSVNSTLAFGWNDGSVDFRDAKSLVSLSPDGDDQISGLVTNGFAFPGQGSYVRMALSPNANAIFCLDDNYDPDVAFLQYIGSEGVTASLDDPTLSIIGEAFAIQLSLAIRVLNADDLMGTIQLFIHQYIIPLQLGFVPTLTNSISFNRSLIAGFLRHLQWETLLVERSEDLSANSGFRSCIAFQAALGFQGQFSLRPTEAMVATVLLNLRFISQAISTALKNQNGDNELKRPDIALFFLPLAGWFLSLICHLTDELLVTRNEFEKSGISSEHIDANVINQQTQQAQSTVLPLLFGAASRSLLRHTCRALKALQLESDKHRNIPSLGPVFREFEIQNRRYPVSIHQFERLIAQVDASIKSAYQSPGIGEAEKKATELQVFIRGEIPPIFTQAVSQLLFQHLTLLKEEINEADLYFLDVSDLALTNDAYTRRKNLDHPIDVITKVKLKKDSIIRRCTRCCSLTEDIAPTKGLNAKSKLSKTCVCGSYWVQLDPEDRSIVQI